MNMVSHIESEPAFALVLASFNIAIAETASYMEIPVIIMQLVQLLAWGITITIGIMSLYGTFKRYLKNKKS